MPAQALRGVVALPDRLLEGGTVVVDDGAIVAVVEDASAWPAVNVVDLGTAIIAPGFIDLHTHGAAGADMMQATPEALATIARAHLAHGLTGFLPTTMTQSQAATIAAVEQALRFQAAQGDDADAGARVLGLHLEGPWLSREYKGAQNERYLAPPAPDAVRALLDAGDGSILIVTIAPELPGAREAIAALRDKGISVSIGHSAATYEQAMEAMAWGATQVTHCFNAMTVLHHRHPGIVGAALLHDGLYAELIADGVHVHPAAMRLLIQSKGRERVTLITDSIAATGLGDGAYELGGQAVQVRDGEARLADGTLAGSTLTLDRAVRNLVQWCGVSVVDALYMAATTPAHAIGLGERKGQVQAGYDADLTILDGDLYPLGVMIAGRLTMY